MEIENHLNKLINRYRNHLAKCDQIIKESQGVAPKTYRRHQEYRKFWKLMLNDLTKLSETVRYERLKNKAR